jgi:hypothetical protein
MKLKLITAVAALMASVSASAGQLDGKALECMRPTHPAPILVSFQDGVATEFRIWKKGTEALIEKDVFSGGEYRVSPTKVEYPTTMGDAMVLDRVTLILGIRNDGKLVTKWQCEVYTSFSDFEAMMEARRAQKQAEIDEQMKGNKI